MQHSSLANTSSFSFFKQKTAYEMRISDWSSDVCSSDLRIAPIRQSHFDDLVIKRAVDPRVESVADHAADVEARVGAVGVAAEGERMVRTRQDRKSTRLNSSH